ncbi:uncharacterized protein [Cherax quadricarinatus]|uniref:uncharacterized protein n=1 Tax=Cherax quadricarinatus TaxID=27406 RepID=UPI00387EA384
MVEHDYTGYSVPEVTSVLGLEWEVKEDRLRLKRKPDGEGKLTRRSLLSKVQTAFDPLGLLTPITIRGRMLVQQTWELNLGWDDPLPETVCQEWDLVNKDLAELHEFTFPRSIGCTGRDYDLHVFCDASSRAYGAVAYLVAGDQVNLVTSRARVTPLKDCSIPKLELTAMLLGARLGKYVEEVLSNLRVTHTYVWTDSEVALQWVQNDRSKLPYVRNRVKEIRELQSTSTILYVPTDQNPADLISRGVTHRKLSKSELWFKGPDWLPARDCWPEQKFVETISSIVHFAGEHDTELFDPRRYSSWRKLIGVTEMVFRFVRKLHDKVSQGRQLSLVGPREYWIRQYQRGRFPGVLEVLATRQQVMASGRVSNDDDSGNSKLVHSLGLFLDHAGLIRCRGRIQNSELSYGAKHPVLLGKEGWATELLIQDAHQRTLHGGFGDTLTCLRQNYWVLKGRAAVKRVLKSCTVCRRYDGRTLPYPGPPPLPQERVHSDRPFETVGIDYTGAITLKNPGDVKEGPQKVYVCLFTCATTRAVHLELAEDMTTETFVKLFRRFTARFSCPRLIISDNGTSFRAADKVFRNLRDNGEVREHLKRIECEWRFIAPRAPWQGGFYERMVGTVKRCIRKVLHGRRVSCDELRTVLIEIEARVNNRPLTYVQNGIDEQEALTPNHMLFGRRIEPFPAILSQSSKELDYYGPDGPPINEELHRSHNRLVNILDKWNQVWRRDYLTTLREHFYGADPEANKMMLSEGDLVLVESEAPRAYWPLGLVVSTHPDKAGRLRMVKVRMNGVETIRPINRLLPLEVHTVGPGHEKSDQRLSELSGRTTRRTALESRAHWGGLREADLI